MAKYINGGLVISIPMSQEYELLPDRYKSSLLLKHRTKKFQYLADRMIMVNPQLKELLSYVRDKVSVRWYKTIRGRILGLVMVRYMVYHMNPQHYSHRLDLVLFANYSIIQNYLQRIVKVLIKNYGLEDKYYGLKIQKQKLYELSKLWANDMFDTSLKMVEHYHKLHPKKNL